MPFDVFTGYQRGGSMLYTIDAADLLVTSLICSATAPPFPQSFSDPYRNGEMMTLVQFYVRLRSEREIGWAASRNHWASA